MDAQLQRLLDDPIFRHHDAMTIGYLVALRGYPEPLEIMRSVGNGYEDGLLLGTQAREAGIAPLFLGYLPDEMMPVKKDQEVTIPKGALIMHRGKTTLNARTRKVKVHHTISGANFYRDHHNTLHTITTPKIVWPGSGGYWSEVDMNEIPEIVEVAKTARRHAVREACIAKLPAAFEAIHQVLIEAASLPYEGFELRVRGQSTGVSFMQIEAVEPGHATVAGFVVENYYEDRKLTLRVVVTSTVCQPLPQARFVFRALSTLMALAEIIDLNHCQPWNAAQ